MVDHVEEKVQIATNKAAFWKDKYVKLAWLENQAIMDIPRSLLMAEGMVDLFKTPYEISQLLELCRRLYDTYHAYHLSYLTYINTRKGKLTASFHRYNTRSKTKNMEHAIEKLEQQNLVLRGEMGQMKEPMNKIFELLTQGATINAVVSA
ncbi:hypothetical protein CR513_56608, partial [Mucuna pruriens]